MKFKRRTVFEYSFGTLFWVKLYEKPRDHGELAKVVLLENENEFQTYSVLFLGLVGDLYGNHRNAWTLHEDSSLF